MPHRRGVEGGFIQDPPGSGGVSYGAADHDSASLCDYTHSEDKFWAMYLSDADKYDQRLVDSWKGDTDAILIFTGLFAGVISTFLVQSYQLLVPASPDVSASLLSQISLQLAAAANGTQYSLPQPTPFIASRPAVRVNILWFLSLLFSLSCALVATLVQQWGRRYLLETRRRGPPWIRGPVQLYLFVGVKRFGLGKVVECAISLLHVSLSLFIIGLVDFVFTLNEVLAWTFFAFAVAGASLYIALSILPLCVLNSPYETPLSPVFRISSFIVVLLLNGLHPVWTWALSVIDELCEPCCIQSLAGNRIKRVPGWLSIHLWLESFYNRRRLLRRHVALYPSDKRAHYALHQTLKNVNEVHELADFFDCLNTFLRSAQVLEQNTTLRYLLVEEALCGHLTNLVQLYAKAVQATRQAAIAPPEHLTRLADITEGIMIHPETPLAQLEGLACAWERLSRSEHPITSLIAIAAATKLLEQFRCRYPSVPIYYDLRWSRGNGMKLLLYPLSTLGGTGGVRDVHVMNFIRLTLSLVRIAHSALTDSLVSSEAKHPSSNLLQQPLSDTTHPLWELSLELLRQLSENVVANPPTRESRAYGAFSWLLDHLSLEIILPLGSRRTRGPNEDKTDYSSVYRELPLIVDVLHRTVTAIERAA